jgi:hypothetical protein
MANTYLLIFKKRALVNAAKSIAGLSDVFTQDMEDYYDPAMGKEEPQKNKPTNGNGKKETPPPPPRNGVSKKAVDLVKASIEYFKHPDLKEYVKNNYKTTTSIEFKDYFYNKATDAEITAYEVFLESLKTKKLNEEYRKSLEEANKEQEDKQTEDQRKRFHKLCNELAFDRQIYLEFAREKAGKKYLSTTSELTRQEMDIVISALEEKLQTPPEDTSSLADEFDEFQKMTEEEAKSVNDINREMVEADQVPF